MPVDSDKVLVADAAYDFPLSNLPKGVEAVLRYVGDPAGTPHLVSVDQVKLIRRTGYVFAPIWTPPDRVFSDQGGHRAAVGMVVALRRYPMFGVEPVFLDIEKHVYDASPSACMIGVEAWQRGMHAVGYRQAYAYLPAEANTQWVADWVLAAPHHFAPGVIGVQYTGGQHGDEYDLSVFSRTVFQPLINAQKGPTVSLTDADHTWIIEQLTTVQRNLSRQARAYHWDNDPKNPEPHANKHLGQKLDQVVELLTGLGTAGVDPGKLADAIVSRLGPTLAADLASELSRRLSS